MRYFSLIWAGLALASCTTPVSSNKTPEPAVKARATDQLSARQVADGECALFVWTAGASPKLTVFIPMDAATADVYHNGFEHQAVLDTPLFEPDPGTAPVFEFTLSGGEPGLLSLEGREPIEGGVRYARGTLKIGDKSADQLVRPVAGVSTCLEKFSR